MFVKISVVMSNNHKIKKKKEKKSPPPSKRGERTSTDPLLRMRKWVEPLGIYNVVRS